MYLEINQYTFKVMGQNKQQWKRSNILNKWKTI